MALLFVYGVGFVVLAVIALNVWALVRWRRIWRVLAVLPALTIGADIALILFDGNPHNMLPFELLFAALFACGALGALWLIQMLINHGRIVQ